MNKFQSIPCFLVLTLALILLISCGGPESKEEYPAEITNVEGVKVVSNPGFPKQGTIHYLMEEELSIGILEGDEENMLNKPQDVKASKDGTIYVLDSGDVCIKVFDENGAYLRTVGQKGQGPGEFGFLIYFALSSDDRIFIMDCVNRRIFNLDIYGKFLEGFRLEGIRVMTFSREYEPVTKVFRRDGEVVKRKSLQRHNHRGRIQASQKI